MSRIIVKNLPKHLTADRFRQHFESKGHVTDAKIMHTQSGRSRLFGFIGYQSEAEAREAAGYFNGTFIDTSKIAVEMAKSIGDPDLPKAWSKYSANSRLVKQQPPTPPGDDAIQKEKAAKIKQQFHGILSEVDQDPKLNEFIEVMKPRSQAKTWMNDDGLGGGRTGDMPPAFITQPDSEDELYDDMPSQKPPAKAMDSLQTDEPKTAEAGSDAAEQDVNADTAAAEGLEAAVKDESMEAILDTGRLFIRNLPFNCSDSDLLELFCKYGPVSEVHIPLTADTKQSKGFAYILFLIPEHALAAFRELDGTTFQGRLLHIIPAREKPGKPDEQQDGGNQSFKQKKKAELKSKSTEDYNWNTLFMSSDAVADAMAKKLNVAKSDILNPEAESMAVRLALAETTIIQDTVQYLKEEGVSIDAFKLNMKKERSDTVIMVKNIPHSTQESDLREMFGQYGDLLRVVIPPTKTIALIEYSTANEAKAGFKAVAYRNYKGKPLLLEKAPTGVFTKPPPERKQQQSSDTASSKTEETPIIIDQVFDAAENDDGNASATLYVKNLKFSTTSEALSQLFGSVEGFRSAKVSMKKSGDRLLSMGFGFVEFRDHQSAIKAMKAFQNTQLDGHSLIIRFSDRSSIQKGDKQSSTTAASAEANSTKLLVRNVPFEATRKDLLTLFGTYGQLKRVRLPKKFDNSSHRGFAFVEFLTKQQAKLAYESLAATHLYGRHLVIEWAKDEESVEALREKTKRQFDTDNRAGYLAGKKQKIDLDGSIGVNATAADSDGEVE